MRRDLFLALYDWEAEKADGGMVPGASARGRWAEWISVSFDSGSDSVSDQSQ